MEPLYPSCGVVAAVGWAELEAACALFRGFCFTKCLTPAPVISPCCIRLCYSSKRWGDPSDIPSAWKRNSSEASPTPHLQGFLARGLPL